MVSTFFIYICKRKEGKEGGAGASRLDTMNNVRPHDFDGLLVVAALRDDEVGIALRGFDELLVHGLEDIAIAVENHLRGASPLYRVALDDADESLVGVGIDEYLQVHEVAKLLFPQGHDAFDDDDLARLDVYGLRQAVTDDVAVGGLLDALALPQGLYLLGEKLPVEGVGMVEVDAPTLFWREVRGVVVIGILRDERHPVSGKRLENLLHDCCLAGTCAAGDADDIHLSIIYGPLPSPPRGSDLKPPLREVWWGQVLL